MTSEKLAKKHQTEPIQYSIAHMHIISIICNCTQKKHDHNRENLRKKQHQHRPILDQHGRNCTGKEAKETLPDGFHREVEGEDALQVLRPHQAIRITVEHRVARTTLSM